MTLVHLLKATTENNATHCYMVKVHGHDGLVRTRTMKISESDSIYGKLRMSGSRWAVRTDSYGSYLLVSEETYIDKLNIWLAKR